MIIKVIINYMIHFFIIFAGLRAPLQVLGCVSAPAPAPALDPFLSGPSGASTGAWVFALPLPPAPGLATAAYQPQNAPAHAHASKATLLFPKATELLSKGLRVGAAGRACGWLGGWAGGWVGGRAGGLVGWWAGGLVGGWIGGWVGWRVGG
jgi:hypothetical protein